MIPRMAGASDQALTNGRAAAGPRDLELKPLVEAIAGGDAAALAQLYDRAGRLVFALASRLLGDPSSAEEVTLDVFLRVWRRAESFDPRRGSVTAWLLAMARSRALDRLRAANARGRRETPLSSEMAASLGERGESGGVQAEIARERRSAVQRALAELPEPQRRAVVLAYFPGLTHVEIAERLGEPLGTVKTRIRLGMKKLRGLLEPLEEGR
jgi:RNA polymerase sigma-70 factor (ECF subfamily)